MFFCSLFHTNSTAQSHLSALFLSSAHGKIKEWGEHSVGAQLLLLLCQSSLPPHPFLLIQLLGHPAPSSRSRVSPPHPALYALATVISLERCPCRHQHRAVPGLWTLWGFGGSGTPRTGCLLSPDRGWSNTHWVETPQTLSASTHLVPPAHNSTPGSAFLQAMLLLAGAPDSQYADKGCPIR